MIVLGIDPGISGGVAVIDMDRTSVHPCPATEADMAELLREYSVGSKAIIEACHSFPGQGVSSTFKFGRNYGTWLGILAALKIPYQQVSPGKWMKYYGAMPKEKTPRKNHLKHLAQQRYPDLKFTLKTADAMLLAVYAQEVAWHD